MLSNADKVIRVPKRHEEELSKISSTQGSSVSLLLAIPPPGPIHFSTPFSSSSRFTRGCGARAYLEAITPLYSMYLGVINLTNFLSSFSTYNIDYLDYLISGSNLLFNLFQA